MGLIDNGDCGAQTIHDLERKLEALVHLSGADMEKQVTGCRDRMMHPVDFSERMQLLRSRGTEKTVPRLRAKSHDAGEAALEIAKADRANES
ncbi:hypothetical protein NUTIK01_33270 [Novosphingobium sp. IK01]|uniref:Uncharacterized protein n=1 Tax=Novosphingobium pituita TaxID=3056842 RepID=A0ABQ6PBR9_9SPHN|nr:hypothetical protein NUTIK01_33270 [Novosphingobium sp. IK01]